MDGEEIRRKVHGGERATLELSIFRKEEVMETFTDALVGISRHFGVLERDTVCCGDVTVPQCVALQRLRREPAGVSSLAAYLGTTVSATTRLVDGLEKLGWVDRRPDPNDGRRVQLVLSETGEAKADDLRASTEELARQLLEYIPDDEQHAVSEALSLLEQALTRCRRDCCGDAGDPGGCCF